MPVQVSINESVSRGRGPRALKKAVKEGLLIRDYLNAEISLGELAELLLKCFPKFLLAAGKV